MLITSLRIRGVGGVKSKDYDLRKSLLLITGINGAGKSSIFEAIVIALFGKGIRSKGLGYFLPAGKKSYSAEVEFEQDKSLYRVIRTYVQTILNDGEVKGNSNVTIYKKSLESKDWGEPINPKGNIKSQKFINSKIGLDYDSFIAISLISADGDNMLFSTGSEILKQITKILDLDLISKIKSEIKSQVKDLEITNKISLQKEADLDEKIKQRGLVLAENKKISYHNINGNIINELKTRNRDMRTLLSKKEAKTNTLQSLAREIKGLDDITYKGVSAYITEFDTEIKKKSQEIINKKELLTEQNISEKIQKCTEVISNSKNSLEKISSKEKSKKDMFTESKDIFSKFDIDLSNTSINPIEALKNLQIESIALEKEKSILEENKQKLNGILDKENTKGVSNEQCPTCGNDISEKHYQHIKEELEAINSKLKVIGEKIKYSSADIGKGYTLVINNKEKRQEITKELKVFNVDEINKLLTSSQKELVDLQRLQKIEKEIAVINNEISAINRSKEDSKDIIEKIEEVNTINKRLREEYIDYKASAVVVYNYIKEVENQEIKTKIFSEIEKHLDKVANTVLLQVEDIEELLFSESNLDAVSRNIELNKANKEKITKNNGSIETLDKDIIVIKDVIKNYKKETKDLPMYKETVKLVNILPNYALFTIAPTLETITNEILAYYEDNIRLRFEINTQVEENNRDAINLKAVKNGVELPMEMLSGGEKSKVNFSFKFAMSALLSKLLNKKTSILFIDEGFGSLDNESRDRLSLSIKKIHDKVEQVFIITHIKDVQKTILNDNDDILHLEVTSE